MAYVIIFLTLALVIGPVLWMKPTQSQARQAKIRQLAKQSGLDVRITELPQAHRALVRRDASSQGVVYRLPVRDPRAVVEVQHRMVRDTDTWEASGDSLPRLLDEALAQVCIEAPADVVAIEIGPQGPGVFWREKGDVETVAQIVALLNKLRDAMAV